MRAVLVLALTLIFQFCEAGKCRLSDPDIEPCRAKKRATQRVRREVKDLTEDQWRRVVDAMWVMKRTSQAEGRRKYGPQFRTYDKFVVRHGVGAMDSRGEQIHLGDHFSTTHGAFILEFEESLLAIDPKIEAAPYVDMSLHDPFIPELFGSAPGTGPGSTVVDGPFAEWPITKNFNIRDWAGSLRNVPESENKFIGNQATKMMRGNMPDNFNPAPFLTRFGPEDRTWCKQHDAEYQRKCAQAGPCWEDWFKCIEAQSGSVHYLNDWHSCAHFAIGGEKENGETPYFGDFADPNTSPNDPFFFFFHANLDRNRIDYMAAHPKEAAAYYGYKGGKNRNGKCYDVPWYTAGCATSGADLNHAMNAQMPWTARDLGLQDVLQSDGVTHAELICHLGPETAPYRYAPPGEKQPFQSYNEFKKFCSTDPNTCKLCKGTDKVDRRTGKSYCKISKKKRALKCKNFKRSDQKLEICKRLPECEPAKNKNCKGKSAKLE